MTKLSFVSLLMGGANISLYHTHENIAVLGILLNGALFGAIHYYNFGSLLGTVPYMVAGVTMNLVWDRGRFSVPFACSEYAILTQR